MFENAGKEKLLSDIRTVLSDAEDLLRAAAASTGDKAVELRERAMIALTRARETVQDTQAKVVEHSRAAARATDDYVHSHPWRAVAVATGAGFLIGLLVNRR